MLDIRMRAALKPISSFSPARLHELLDYCHLETIDDGQDPLGKRQPEIMIDGNQT